jgi:hypothetical protein
MSINSIQSKFLSSENTAIYFDCSKDFFIKRKNNGTFLEGIHWVQPVTQMLRWNIPELEKWFGVQDKKAENNPIEQDLNLEHFLK